jgi:hypothetical protein
MAGSHSDDGHPSDIPPVDPRKSLADFLAPRASRPPSLSEFLRPPKSGPPPKSGRPPVSSVPPPYHRRSIEPPSVVPPPHPRSIELTDVEPPPRPSIFSEAPVPRASRSLIPRPAKMPVEGDAFEPRPSEAPELDHDDEPGRAGAALAKRGAVAAVDDAELDAEMTSTRRWLEARRSSHADVHAPAGEPALRHTAEPVWNPTDRHVDDVEPSRTSDADSDRRQSPAVRRAVGIAIVAGATLITLFVVRTRSRHAAPPPTSASASSAVVPPEEGSGIPAPPEPTNPSEAPRSADTAALRREARELLATGHAEDGVRLARQVIEQDPHDSEAYVLLAAGLQDLGKWQESREIFENCVQRAKGADTAECLYFARRAP